MCDPWNSHDSDASDESMSLLFVAAAAAVAAAATTNTGDRLGTPESE